MIPRDEVEAFWEVTRDCLVRFHGISSEVAAREVAALRGDLARTWTPGAVPMIYHDEPFNVACDIARQQLDRFEPAVAEEYYAMLDRPFPLLADLPPAEYPPGY